MKQRPIYTEDLPILQKAIDDDKFHPGQWKLSDFEGFSEVFEDTYGPVVFVVYGLEDGGRLRISTMWVTPDEAYRNARAIVFLVNAAAQRARDAGFRELIFTTTHEPLARFCVRIMKFVSIGGDEFVLPLKEGTNVRP